MNYPDFQKPVSFLGESFKRPDELLTAMAASWEEGIRFLRQDAFRQLKDAGFSPAGSILMYRREMEQNPDRENRIFLRWLYGSCRFPRLYWTGNDYGDSAAVIRDYLEDRSYELNALIDVMLEEQLLSRWLLSQGTEEKICSAIAWIEQRTTAAENGFQRKLTHSYVRAILKPRRIFLFDGNAFASLEEFSRYLKQLADTKKLGMEQKIHPLLADEHNLAPDFEGWLICQGALDAVKSWDQAHLRSRPDTSGFAGMQEAPSGAAAGEPEPESTGEGGSFVTETQVNPDSFERRNISWIIDTGKEPVRQGMEMVSAGMKRVLEYLFHYETIHSESTAGFQCIFCSQPLTLMPAAPVPADLFRWDEELVQDLVSEQGSDTDTSFSGHAALLSYIMEAGDDHLQDIYVLVTAETNNSGQGAPETETDQLSVQLSSFLKKKGRKCIIIRIPEQNKADASAHREAFVQQMLQAAVICMQLPL